MPAIIPVLLPPPVSARLPLGDGELVSATAAADVLAAAVGLADGASLVGEFDGTELAGVVGESDGEAVGVLLAPHSVFGSVTPLPTAWLSKYFATDASTW